MASPTFEDTASQLLFGLFRHKNPELPIEPMETFDFARRLQEYIRPMDSSVDRKSEFGEGSATKDYNIQGLQGQGVRDDYEPRTLREASNSPGVPMNSIFPELTAKDAANIYLNNLQQLAANNDLDTIIKGIHGALQVPPGASGGNS